MKQIILGTAGHIDHGKTSLIKAVTGINTDRLKEEQLRGITIELGFASLDLPNGNHIGIVDVPGHEKFVKNMVAGATGIDIVAMVIAADEGVMPQTKEHLEICSLLGIQYGFVVLTKIDLVDQEWLELVKEDIKDFLQGTFLEGTPLIHVSSATGQGIAEFISTLDNISSSVPEHISSGLFRLPADRVFTMKGFGTVITGTLVSGKVNVGDNIMIYPSCITSKVRGLQVHNAAVNSAEAGMRTAINFQGLEKSSINRGDVVSTPGALKPSYMVDISLTFLDSNKRPLKNRTRVRFHTGTSEILGNVVLLENAELAPGEQTVAQLRLDSPVTTVKDDRFVIRSYSPIRTIGGGHIINPIPGKHKGLKPEAVAALKKFVEQSADEIISYHLNAAGYHGLSHSDLKIMTNLPEKQLNSTLADLLSKKIIILVDKEKKTYIHNNIAEKIQQKMTKTLASFHEINPLKTGMSKQELRSKLSYIPDSKSFNLILNQMIKNEAIESDEDIVKLASHSISLADDQAENKEKILDLYRNAGLSPPYFKEIPKILDIEAARAKDVLMILVNEGLIIKTKEDLYFANDVLMKLRERLVEFLETNGEITTPQFKDMTGVSRKYVIPLIEYFDSKNLTIRIGDIRKLRK